MTNLNDQELEISLIPHARVFAVESIFNRRFSQLRKAKQVANKVSYFQSNFICKRIQAAFVCVKTEVAEGFSGCISYFQFDFDILNRGSSLYQVSQVGFIQGQYGVCFLQQIIRLQCVVATKIVLVDSLRVIFLLNYSRRLSTLLIKLQFYFLMPLQKKIH